jgi:hypothetical protein
MRIARYLLLLLMLMGSFRAQPEVVDRMVAVVNKRVILESELDQTVRVELLLQNRPLSVDNSTRSQTLDQLIDRRLLEQQITQLDVVDPTPEELAARIKMARDHVTGAATDQGWKSALVAYGVTERDVEEHLISELRSLRFVDLHFRGLVPIDKSAIAAYYAGKLLPQLSRQGAPAPPLADVSDKIERILMEERLGGMLTTWLQTLRVQARIQKMAPFDSDSPRGTRP